MSRSVKAVSENYYIIMVLSLCSVTIANSWTNNYRNYSAYTPLQAN